MVNSVKLNQYNQCYIKYGFLYNRARSAKTIVFPKGLNTFQFLYCTRTLYTFLCTCVRLHRFEQCNRSVNAIY